jgi:hypothetical protein
MRKLSCAAILFDLEGVLVGFLSGLRLTVVNTAGRQAIHLELLLP